MELLDYDCNAKDRFISDLPDLVPRDILPQDVADLLADWSNLKGPPPK